MAFKKKKLGLTTKIFIALLLGAILGGIFYIVFQLAQFVMI